MKNRSELREVVVKVIYQTIILEEAKLDNLIAQQYLGYKHNEEQFYKLENLSKDRIKEVVENKNTLIKLADKYLTSWTIDRLNKVDQAILLLGIYELKYTETPSVVAINEAIELSKRYSDEAVTKMINGVLDKVYHEEEQ